MTPIANTIKVHPKLEVSLDLSSPQTSGMGLILGKMYYQTRITDLISGMSSGYPHNGGHHSFYIKGPYKDVIATLELIRDETPVAFHPTVVDAKNELTTLCSIIKEKVEQRNKK